MAAEPQTRLAYVDSMRLVAAALVFAQHLFEARPGFGKTYLIPLAPGVAGVALFFFISGFVIPMAARGGLDIRQFMIRRFFRIYPLYLAALAVIVAAAVSGLLPQLDVIVKSAAFVWAANLLLVAEYVGVLPFIGVAWTLSVELIWYAMFAVFVLMFGKRAADRLDVLMPASLIMLTIASLAIGERLPLGRPTMIYAAVIGFQCYRFQFGEIDAARLRLSIVVFAIVGLVSNYVAFGYFQHPNLTMLQAIGPWVTATVVFLIWTLYRPLREVRLLNRGWMPVLGAMSYSIYMLHTFATSIAFTHFPPELQVLVACVLTLALAWAGYTFVEKPGIALGRRLSRRSVALPGETRTA
ncbi:MAG: acyltransferase family protein [Sphingomonadaceae bacterium]